MVLYSSENTHWRHFWQRTFLAEDSSLHPWWPLPPKQLLHQPLEHVIRKLVKTIVELQTIYLKKYSIYFGSTTQTPSSNTQRHKYRTHTIIYLFLNRLLKLVQWLRIAAILLTLKFLISLTSFNPNFGFRAHLYRYWNNLRTWNSQSFSSSSYIQVDLQR